jgi:hypothetical protein
VLAEFGFVQPTFEPERCFLTDCDGCDALLAPPSLASEAKSPERLSQSHGRAIGRSALPVFTSYGMLAQRRCERSWMVSMPKVPTATSNGLPCRSSECLSDRRGGTRTVVICCLSIKRMPFPAFIRRNDED